MAKLIFLPSHPDNFQMFTQYEYGTLGLHSGTQAIYEAGTEGQLIFSGKGLAYDDRTLVGGTITSLAFKDENGAVSITLSDFKLKVSDLPESDQPYLGFYTAIRALKGQDTLTGSSGKDVLEGYGGNDVLIGKAGNDDLRSSGGNDTMTGGAGQDTFILQTNRGRDTITDFAFAADNHDILELYTFEYDSQKTSKGLVIEIEDASILLLGVKSLSQIENYIYVNDET